MFLFEKVILAQQNNEKQYAFHEKGVIT